MTDVISKQNILQLVSSPLILGGVPIYLYDTFIEKKDMYKSLYDASLMSGSMLATKIGSDLLSTKILD